MVHMWKFRCRTGRNPLGGGICEALLFTACPAKLSSDNARGAPRSHKLTHIGTIVSIAAQSDAANARANHRTVDPPL